MSCDICKGRADESLNEIRLKAKDYAITQMDTVIIYKEENGYSFTTARNYYAGHFPPVIEAVSKLP